MRLTLDELPSLKNKNKPRAPREEPPNGNELPNVVWAVSAPEDPLTKGTACGHGSMVALLPYPIEVVLRSPSLVEVESCPETPIKVSGMAARAGAVPFSTPFRAKIISPP